MVGEEIQPRLLIPLLLAMWVCVSGLPIAVLAIAFGDWKPDWRLWLRRSGHLVIFSLVLVATGGSQNQPAQAQQDATRRIERLEDQSRSLEGLTRELNQFSQSQANRINDLVTTQTQAIVKIEASLAQHDERIKQLEGGLTRIEATAEGVNSTMRWIGGTITLAVGIMGGVVVWQQRKKPHWANGPLDALRDTQEKILKVLEQSNLSRRRTR